MNVMYACDNNFIWLMGISMISLLENNKKLETLNIYLLGDNISDDNKRILNEIAKKYEREFEVIDVPKIDLPTSLISKRWPLCSLARLYSATLLPKSIDRILYLDSDTIVRGDISELESIDFGGNIVLGVKDCISGLYKKNIGLDKHSPYINSGVIIFDINELRKIDINHEITNYIDKHKKLINYPDQDIINGIFKERIGLLSPKYNFMTIEAVHSYKEIVKLRKPTNFYSREEIDEAKKNPTIVHFTTNMMIIRPWFNQSNHPLASDFDRYFSNSPWKDFVKNEAIFDSKEDKIIKLVMKFPKPIAYWILGIMHSVLKPMYIRIKPKK